MAPVVSGSWRVDETYIKGRGKWTYLYRAVDRFGNTIDFYLSATRNTKAAKRFLGKALRGLKDWENLMQSAPIRRQLTAWPFRAKSGGQIPTRH
jgi:transposase-like protein